MGAIQTNMTSKMAADNKSNMAAVDNKNGRQYGRHYVNKMASKMAAKNWGLHLLTLTASIFSRKVGSKLDGMIVYTKLCKNAFLTAVKLKKIISSITGDAIRTVKNQLYSKNNGTHQGTCQNCPTRLPGRRGEVNKNYSKNTPACTNEANNYTGLSTVQLGEFVMDK